MKGLAAVLCVVVLALDTHGSAAGEGASAPTHKEEPASIVTRAAKPETLPGQSLPLEKIGARPLRRNGLTVTWYEVRVDHDAVGSSRVWSLIACPAGTEAAYIADCFEVRWCEFQGEGVESMYSAPGFWFYNKDRTIKPGPSPDLPDLGIWLFHDEAPPQRMTFRLGHTYVFCFDQKPEKDAKVVEVLSFRGDLRRLFAVIAVVPTFEYEPRPGPKPFAVTRDSLVSLREGTPEDATFALERRPDGTFRAEYGHEKVDAVPDEVVQMLLHELNSCSWERLSEPPVFEPPDRFVTWSYTDDKGVHTGTAPVDPYVPLTLTYRTEQGGLRTAVTQGRAGCYRYFTDEQGAWYRADQPIVLQEVNNALDNHLRDLRWRSR